MPTKRFCLQCDDGTLLAHGKKDLTITLGALSTTVPAVSGWHCPACADCQFDDGEGQRYGAALRPCATRSTSNAPARCARLARSWVCVRQKPVNCLAAVPVLFQSTSGAKRSRINQLFYC